MWASLQRGIQPNSKQIGRKSEKAFRLLHAEGRLEEGKNVGAKTNGVFLLAINCWRLAVYSAELLLRISSTVLHIIMGIFWQSWGLGYWPGCPCTALLRLKYEVLTGRQWSLNSSVSLKMLNLLFLCVSKMRYRERLRFLRASFLEKGRYSWRYWNASIIGFDCVPLPVVESRKKVLGSRRTAWSLTSGRRHP